MPLASRVSIEALAFMVVGDHRGVTGVRRIDQRWNSARLSVIAQHHGPQIEPHRGSASPRSGRRLVMNFDLFVDEFEILGVKLRVRSSNIAAAMAIGQNAGTLGSDRFAGIADDLSNMLSSFRRIPFDCGLLRAFYPAAMTLVRSSSGDADHGPDAVCVAVCCPAKASATTGFMLSTIDVGIRIVAPRSLVVS